MIINFNLRTGVVGTGELVRQRQVQGFNVGLEAYRQLRPPYFI
jgi:hypothetical protein